MKPNAVASTTRAARALPVLVTLSGAAALVYESLWMRSFGLIFGNTTSAVAMVLAVFMGGLAIGSALSARRPSPDPLRSYGRVELGVGLSALLSLPLLRVLPWAYGRLVAFAGVSDGLELAGRMALAASVLLPATLLLGATVPLALAFLERAGRDVRGGFGTLYLLNTLGGALGVALAVFLLMPAAGVRGTLVLAAMTSLGVGGLALRWSREIGCPAAPTPLEAAPSAPTPHVEDRLGPMLATLSGAATFGVEVLWTRSLALVIGSSVYAFNLVLLAVLLGIGVGTVAYPRIRGRVSRPARAVGMLFVSAGVAVLAGQCLVGYAPLVWYVLMGVLPLVFSVHQAAALALCLLVLLPVTALLGVTFPLLLHLSEARPGASQRAAGRLYAWNTAGAVSGALAADLWLVPRLGLQPPYLVFAGLLLAGGVWALGEPWRVRSRAAVTLAAWAVLMLLVPRWTPWDAVVMTSGVHRYGLVWHDGLVAAGRLRGWLRERRSLLFYREGAEAVVAVAETKDASRRRFLSVNGKTDAGSSDVVTQKFIAHVPLLLHGGARRVLVIGWGAGATAASAALHPIESLECVEIEPATWEAAPLFADLSGGVQRDPRFRILFADGRNHLLRARVPYDVIVSEPSNPWITGVANLFTREFYEAALDRLAPEGVFGQWFPYYNLEPADVKVEVKTFLSVFPHSSLWLVPPVGGDLGADLLLVGSREAQSLDWTKVDRAFIDPGIGADLRATGVLRDPMTLVAAWTMGRAEMARWSEDRALFPRGVPLNTDDYPYIEIMAPRRNLTRPADTARIAMGQYEEMSRASGDLAGWLQGQPALNSGGAVAAVFLDRLAERYDQASQTDRAITTFLAAARNDPRDAHALSRAGVLLFERGRPGEAEAPLREAVRVDPTRARAWEALGSIALDRRDYARAEEAHRALLRLEPANVSAWLRLGAALARQAQWAGAKDALDTARSIDKNAPIDPQLSAYVDRMAGETVRR